MCISSIRPLHCKKRKRKKFWEEKRGAEKKKKKKKKRVDLRKDLQKKQARQSQNMHASTFIAAGLFMAVGSALGFPSASDTGAIIEKRIIGGGGDDGDMDMARPLEWIDLPPLEPFIREAYNQQIQLEALSFMAEGELETAFQVAVIVTRNKFTYLTPEEVFAQVQALAPLLREQGSIANALERKLSELDVPTLERQLEEIVAFRREHETPGAPGQESWRYRATRRRGDPMGLPSPFDSITEAQDKILIVAKARSGMTSRRRLAQYIRSRDPYLSEGKDRTATVVNNALSDYNFRPRGFGRGSRGD